MPPFLVMDSNSIYFCHLEEMNPVSAFRCGRIIKVMTWAVNSVKWERYPPVTPKCSKFIQNLGYNSFIVIWRT